jgi:5-oxoprolinase (ATP-hydrolysing)
MQGHGPALIVSGQSTTVIPPHYRFAIDGVGTLIATRLESRKMKPRKHLESKMV